MKILFDHQVFDSQVNEGASRYFVELGRHLIAEGVAVEFAVRQTDNIFLHADPRWAKQIIHHPRQNHLLARLRALAVRAKLVPYMSVYRANEDASLAALKKGDFNIFHPTYYEPYFFPHLATKPFVVTVHDMIHELFPQYVKPRNPTTQWKKKVFAAAAHVISVSENTKQDLIRLCQIPAEKITVVHHGVGTPFSNPLSLKRERGGVRVLYLGARERYKNFACLLEALPVLVRQHPDLKLICAGGGEFTSTEKEKMRKLGVSKYIEQRQVDDAQLADLYRDAAAFIFPSLYEGFGLPILEAMACGCPAVLARASAFPEVGGDAALYFDPQNPADLVHVFQELLASANIQEKFSAAGKKRAAQFTWQRAAIQTQDIYSMILSL